MLQFYHNINFRVGMEPFKLIISVFKLPIELVKHQNNNEILPYLVENNNKISQFLEIKNAIFRLLTSNNEFQRYFLTDETDSQLQGRIQSFFAKIQHMSLSEKAQLSMDEIKNELKLYQHHFQSTFQQFLCSNNKITFEDVLLVEILIFLNHLYPFWLYEDYQTLYQYKCRVLTINLFQKYWFDLETLLLPYGPLIDNLPRKISLVIEKNLPTMHDLALCHGILYQYRDEQNKVFIDNCPVSLFPLYINSKIITDLKQKTLIQQRLIDYMSYDFGWYQKIFAKLSEHDFFINKMLAIQQKVESCKTKCKCKLTQPYNLCIVRNDFMHQASINQWLQVEYNCIAISFGFISDRVQKYHSDLFNTYYRQIAEQLNVQIKQDWNKDMLIEALSSAHMLYGNQRAQILIITAEFEGNLFDQRYMELGLAKKGICCKRTTFARLVRNLELSANGTLSAFGTEIAVVYLRTGYTFDQYESEDCWKVRELIELSRAIKCPSMNTQLVNFKKLQQVLLEDKHINRFLSEHEAKRLKENYCKIWGFDNPEEHPAIIEMVKQNPHDYVLKPQREGGGNNFYDDQILAELEKIAPERRNEFILMERIKPVPRVGFMLRKGQLETQSVISEISVLGYFISENQKMLKNEVGGYMVRTKRYLDNEGGVAAGYAVIDSFMVQDVNMDQ